MSDPTSPLADRTYRRLFAAQVVSLVGTGVSTVALGLLAFELSGADAGAVLGVALALKMVAYVVLSPVVAAFAHRVDRRRLMVGLDVARAAVLAALPFVTAVWQVLVLLLVVHACAAAFTPAFQAVIPEVLPDEAQYTRALSLSRVAYDLEELLSPVLAAGLLLLVDFHALFALDAVSFGVSAALVLSVALPGRGEAPSERRAWQRITLGARAYLSTPRLRGLLALNVAVAAASAMTIVNTVVLVRDRFDLGASSVAVALAFVGAGSIAAAAVLPKVLEHTSDRSVMLVGGVVLTFGLAVSSVVASFAALLGVWFALGVGLSLGQTPAGRLLTRSGTVEQRPALFAAQFSLSHACWLLTYPVAGVVGAAVGIDVVGIALAVVAGTATGFAAVLWAPGRDPVGSAADRRITAPGRP